MTEHHRAIVIGAGIGGIATAWGFLKDGMTDFVILEQASGPGGTWHHNRYPGAECDVMSHLYSFSFAPNPRWTRRYARQPEILAYIKGTIQKLGITPHLRLSTTVQAMTWSDDHHRWLIETDKGQYSADYVVGAVGMFNEPMMPSIEGLGDFGGRVIHTARWPQGEMLDSKRVAVIGTAATSVQLVPEIAATVDQLYVIQRTPVLVLPKDDRPYTKEEIDAFVTYPMAMIALREQLYNGVNSGGRFEDPEQRKQAVVGGEQNISQVQNEIVREKLRSPLPWGARRPIISNHYYPAFNRPNVELVTESIARIEPNGVRLVDGRLLDVDVIVCATGFAVSKYISVIDVIGREGRRLRDDWADDPYAYLGVLVPGYPNLVSLYGPNTNNGSLVTMIESAAAFAVRHLRWMTDADIASSDIRRDVTEAYNLELQAELDTVEVWQLKPDGYYRGKSGRIVTQWPLSMSAYDEKLRAIDPSLFEIVELASVQGNAWAVERRGGEQADGRSAG